jgi:4-aminobutyrate aminotransferase-like enzyme
VIKIRPPLVITEKQCDLLIAALDQTLHELSGEET